jgi:hypothetical protein
MNAASACHVQQNGVTCKHFSLYKLYSDHISKRKESIVLSSVNTTLSNTISEGDGFGISRTMGDNNKKKTYFVKIARIIDPFTLPRYEVTNNKFHLVFFFCMYKKGRV